MHGFNSLVIVNSGKCSRRKVFNNYVARNLCCRRYGRMLWLTVLAKATGVSYTDQSSIEASRPHCWNPSIVNAREIQYTDRLLRMSKAVL